MKEKLEARLKDLANKILDNNAPPAAVLKNQAKELYEKLTILAFTEENLAAFSSEEEVDSHSKAEAEEVKSLPAQQEQPVFPISPAPNAVAEKDEYLPDGTEYNDSEAITEPNTEKIKDIVAQMPPEISRLDDMVHNIISNDPVPPAPQEVKPEVRREAPPEVKPEIKTEPERDFRDIGVDYDKLPDFEPVKKAQEKERPKSLNDRLKKGFNIGLNERLAFIRHLFDGNTSDYNRVISQLSTFDSKEEAKKFIQLVVKPDYKYWQGKEEYEKKFMELVENKFGH